MSNCLARLETAAVTWGIDGVGTLSRREGRQGSMLPAKQAPKRYREVSITSWRRQTLLMLAACAGGLILTTALLSFWWLPATLPGSTDESDTIVHIIPNGSASGFGELQQLPASHIRAAAKYLQEVVLSDRSRRRVAAAKYVIRPESYHMQVQHKKVAAHLSSEAFRTKIAKRKAHGGSGIIINAGGPALLSSAIVALKVLREVHKCQLPVELVWHSPEEMDETTLQAMQLRWGPVIGVNLSSMTWPQHHRHLPADKNGPKGLKFLGKVMSLTVSSFASALLVDADNLLLSNPEELWQDAGFAAQGNLFWPDFWSSAASSSLEAEHEEIVYDMVGLEYKQAQPLLSAGKGWLKQRDTESGQLLLDLVTHADVAEWALWINSFGDQIYNAVWGDKDTYALAFAVAGKAHRFTQVQVPPGAALTWRANKLLIKATQQVTDGWQLAGMVQFNSWGQPAFLHRTMNKFAYGGNTWHIGRMTGPLPDRWVQYYLSQESLGPTVGVPYDYVVPDEALVAVDISKLMNNTMAARHAADTQAMQGCPVSFAAYWNCRQYAALPVGASSAVEASCRSQLTALLGITVTAAYDTAGLLAHPELAALAALAGPQEPVNGQTSLAPAAHEEHLAGSSPVLAWVPDYPKAAVTTSVTHALAGSYAAMEWLQEHSAEFPIFSIGRRSTSGHNKTSDREQLH